MKSALRKMKVFRLGNKAKNAEQKNGQFSRMENTVKTAKAFPSLTIDEINHIQDTLPYVNIHMNEILNEAFITMFTLNPDIQDKFFKDHIAIDDSDEIKEDQDEQSRGLQRHIPRVARALSKILSHVDDLHSIRDY